MDSLKVHYLDYRSWFEIRPNITFTSLPFMSKNTPILPAYGFSIAELKPYPRACSNYEYFILRDTTPPGHLVSPLVCRGPWMSIVVLYCWCHSDSASVLLYFTLKPPNQLLKQSTLEIVTKEFLRSIRGSVKQYDVSLSRIIMIF